MKIVDQYKFAWFSELAYVRWEELQKVPTDPIETAAIDLIAAAHAAERIPGVENGSVAPAATLGEAIFLPSEKNGLDWKLAHFRGNDPDSGFAASLYTNPVSAESVLAIRGTELDDLNRDLLQADLQQIGGLGVAISQAVSMFNYVRRLQAPPGNPVTQLTLRSGPHAPAAHTHAVAGDSETFWVEAAASGVGLGLLHPLAPVVVTGHSLGGHLAALALRLFPDQFSAAVTFNAPGFDALLGLDETEAMIAQLAGIGGAGVAATVAQVVGALTQTGKMLTDEFVESLLAPHLPRSAPPKEFFTLAGEGRLISLVAEDQAPGNDAAVFSSLIAGIPASPREDITVEINSHGMGGLLDALGVQTVFERLDATLDLGRAGRLMALSSARGEDAQEQLLERLGDLFLPDGRPRLPIAAPQGAAQVFAAPSPFEHRGVLHARLLELEAAIGERGDLSVVTLEHVSRDTLRARAASDVAWRYALNELNPFVIEGDEQLYSGRDELALSADYRADRAEMLTRLNHARWFDLSAGDGLMLYAGHGNIDFVDEVQGIELAQVEARDLPGGLNRALLNTLRGAAAAVRQVRFVADAAAHGDRDDDRLYGLRGNNELLGFGGADYLEAGAGVDVLYGNDRDNHEDNVVDRLVGGTGLDQYWLGDGDIVDDADRQAELRIGRADISLNLGGVYTRVADGVYRNHALNTALYRRDGRATLVRFDPLHTLTITLENFADPVSGFRNGDYGIVLEEDMTGAASILGSAGDDGLSAGREISGTGGDDHINALAGHDTVFGGAGQGPWGADRMVGGAGHDYLDSATLLDLGRLASHPDDPGDWFDAGAGDDVLVGNGGDDQQYGGDGEDFLSGRDGRDVLHGGPGDDVLSGGGGDDLLLGGAGNDFLFSAFDVWATPDHNWVAAPQLDAEGRLIDIKLSGVIVGVNPPPADHDVLDGGPGDDFLNGGNGNDKLDGGDGVDVLFGWRGHDQLGGGAGDDVLYGDTFGLAGDADAGDDVLDGGAGNDVLYGERGQDRLHGAGGDDVLRGGAGRDVLDGGAGADELFGGAEGDVLDGGDGDDTLDGGAGADALAGGPGDDVLRGGSGHDVYLVRAGDGHDHISDSGGFDTVIVAGVTTFDLEPQQAASNTATLRLDAHSSVTLHGWYDGAIERVIVGDRIIEPDRADEGLRAFEMVADGLGDDLYRFVLADGNLSIVDPGGRDSVLFDDTINLDAIAAIVDADDTWRADVSGVTLSIAAWSEAPIERFVFADGPALDYAAMDIRARHAPRVHFALADQHVVSGAAFHFDVHPLSFRDIDPGDVLDFQARLADGSALPAWLDFDPLTQRFSGSAPLNAAGSSVEIRLGVRDRDQLEASDAFFIDVLPPPDPQGAIAFVTADDLDGHNGSMSAGAASFFADPEGGTVRADYLDAAGDLNDDGFDDVIRFRAAETYGVPDTVEVVFGRAAGFGTVLGTGALDGRNGFVLTGAGAYPVVDTVGETLARELAHGDVNGDGIDDLVLPAGDAVDSGARVVLGRRTDFAPSIGFETLPLHGPTGLPDPGDGLLSGYFPVFEPGHVFPFASAGDVNGDGIRDRIYGAGVSDDQFLAGAVVFGAAQEQATALRAADLDGSQGFALLPASFAAGLGHAARNLGDVNGDGFDDIGLTNASVSFDLEEQLAAVVYGRADGYGGAFGLDELDGRNGYFAVLPTAQGTLHTASARAAGDINGDGHADVIMTSSWSEASYVVYGTPDAAAAVRHGTPGDDVLQMTAPGAMYSGGGDDQVTIRVDGPGRYELNTGSGHNLTHIEATAGALSGSGATVHVRGGDGVDVYAVNTLGGGLRVVISDPAPALPSASPGYRGNVLQLSGAESGVGLRERVRLSRGSLVLGFGDDAAEIHLENFDPDHVFDAPRDIDRFDFGDGVELSYRDLIARGFDLAGSDAAEAVSGTEVVDRISTFGGDDRLFGGRGNDFLSGGIGNDDYVYRRGDGDDHIEDAGGTDRIIWGAGVTVHDLTARASGEDLELSVAGGGGIVVADWFSNADKRVELFEFSDGSSIDAESLLNHAPQLRRPLRDAQARVDEWFRYRIRHGRFFDPDRSQQLELSARLESGEALPEWLEFDPGWRTFTGTPGALDDETLQIVVTASDPHNATVSDMFTLSIENNSGATAMNAAGNDHDATATSAARPIWVRRDENGARVWVQRSSPTSTAALQREVPDVLPLVQAMAVFSTDAAAHGLALTPTVLHPEPVLAVAWDNAG